MEWYTTCFRSSPWAAQKLKFMNFFFFDIVTTHNDHPSYIEHILGSFRVFFLNLFGYLVRGRGGSPKAPVHILLMHFFILGSLDIECWDIRDVRFFLIIVAMWHQLGYTLLRTISSHSPFLPHEPSKQQRGPECYLQVVRSARL